MYGNLADKIKRLESLDNREMGVLLFIMGDQDIRIVDIANRMALAESTTRNILTSIYTKLRVPEGERDKRGYLVREYSEAYRVRFLKTKDISPYGSKPGEVIYVDTRRNEPRKPEEEIYDSQPRIVSTPEPARVNRTAVMTGMMGGFLLVAVCAIGALAALLFVLNRPQPTTPQNNPPPVSAPIQNTQVSQPVAQSPTQAPVVVVVPTNPPQVVQPTPIPPTPLPPPTPKAFYNQGEGALLRDGVSLMLSPDFLTATWSGCYHQPGFVVIFIINNKTSSDFLARYDRYGFSAIDSTGKVYTFEGSGNGSCDNSPGAVTTSVMSNGKNQFVLSYSGEIPLEARYIEITVSDISGSGRIVFRKIL